MNSLHGLLLARIRYNRTSRSWKGWRAGKDRKNKHCREATLRETVRVRMEHNARQQTCLRNSELTKLQGDPQEVEQAS